MLLLTAAPAVAIDIAPSLLVYAIDSMREPGTPLIEFDRDDWAAFIGGGAAQYRLPELADAIDTTALPASESKHSIITQVWERR
jgi:hypothetical protein